MSAAHAPKEIHERLQAAFDGRDIEALIALYDEDATLIVPPAGERVSGRDAIRAALESILALEPNARFEVAGKLEGDGLAVTHGRWTISAIGADGAPFQISGRGTMVSRRQPDGSWRIALDDPMSPE